MPTRVPIPERRRGHDACIGFLGKSNMVEMDSISSNPSLVPWGGVETEILGLLPRELLD